MNRKEKRIHIFGLMFKVGFGIGRLFLFSRLLISERLTFLFSKKLQKTDVDSISFLFVLFQKPSKTYVPSLIGKEVIILEMDGMDSMHVWCFKFMEFDEEQELQLGDYIMLY
uniref:Uncharacterized protein n=1 Tax=Lactuca sativa TaxID=4236 RepID=A0A9R1W9C0_LACSA|nr:hypothetical protein LSAT_V11C300125790 [Lactuca sativa]